MRFFSRIGSWLRTRGASVSSGESQSTAPLPVLDPDLLARLPRTPPAAFQARMLEAMEASRRGVQVVQLDPTVRLIAMSQRDASDDNDIDNALRSVETSGVQWSSLTWSALRDARPPFSPPPTEWGGELSHLLDGDAGLIFFIDIEAIAVAVSQAAEQLGLTAIIEDDGGVVRVSDGRFQAMLGTSTIIAEALWTGCGPLSSLVRRVRQVPHELRSFVSVMKALERTYVGARFEVVGDHLLARRATGAPLRIDYRHLAAAARASGVGGDTFLQGALLEDLTEQPGEVVTLLRSPAWARAWPEMLSRTHDDGGVVCVAREVDGRVRAVPGTRQDRPERLAFLEREARRQLPFMQVTGHAFVVEQPSPDGRSLSRVFGLVSDRSASLLLDPALLRGFFEQLGPVPAEIDVATSSENVLVVAPRGTATVAMNEALRRGGRLEVDLLEDGADPLIINKTVSLPTVGAGHFDLTVVPDEYFALSDQAAAATDFSRINGDYVRGLALEAIGLHDKAVSSFERAVRARNDDGEVNLALGRALSAVGNYERAVSVLNRASGFLPEHAELQNALGVAHYKTGASTHARAAFLRAVHLSPDEVGFLVNLGRTCCDEEMFTEAQAVLEHALRMEPSSAEAHASMAVLCHRTGNRPQALHHARAALAEEPDDDTVQELLRMIDDDVEPGIS